MKKRFTEEQIIGFLKEAKAGMAAKELCRKHGFSDASFYTWRAKFGRMEVSEARRLKELEAENAKLKKLLAEAMLDMEALKVVVKGKPRAHKPSARRSWRFGRRSTSPSGAPAGLSGCPAAGCITKRKQRQETRCSRRGWSSWRTSVVDLATGDCTCSRNARASMRITNAYTGCTARLAWLYGADGDATG